jgi:hypothetical protein
MQTIPTIYNGRDNTLDLALLLDDEVISADFVTGVSVNVYDKRFGSLLRYIEGRAGQPNAQPSLFDFSNEKVVQGSHGVAIKYISLMLGLAVPRIPARPSCYVEVILWTPAAAEGINWIQFGCAVDAESPVLP